MSKAKVEDIEFTGGYSLLMLKAEEGNIEEVRRILTELKNIDINAANKKGYTALALSVKAGHIEVVKLLISLGGDPNIKNNSGQSPLFLACWNNYENIVKLLLAQGVEINAVDHRGWTPLMIAAYHGHKQIVKELLSNHADTSIQDLFGKKAIDRAKDQAVIKMLQNSSNKSEVFSPRKQDKSITYGSPQMSIDSKLGKKQPPSILKKSSSKTSIGQSAKVEKYGQGLLSPSSTGGFSAQKATTQNSAQRRLTEPRRTSNQFKAVPQRKEVNSAEKVTPGLKNTLSEAISPIRTATSVRISNSPSSGLERQLFKEDMEKLLSDQMGVMSQKIQQIVEHKVALEIPMQMQGYENQFKKQVESLLRFKAADIFKNLQAIFNIKLKFCLNRLGYDTGNLGLSPFLETETNFVPESISFSKEPLKLYNEKEFKAIENDIDRLEKSILNQKVNPSSVRSSQLESASPKGLHRNCDHTSQTHRTEIKNDLIDHLGHEVRSTTEYLLEYSNTKVNELAREESGMLYKKILAEVTDNMEALEDELKKKFEEVITQKMNRITDMLGSAAGPQSDTFDTIRSAEKLNSSSNQRNYPSALTNSSEHKFRPKYEADYGVANQPEEKYANDFNNYPSMRDSGYSDRRVNDSRANDIRAKGNQEISQAKQRIQRIKNSLNFMDDEEGESRPEKLMQSGLNRSNGYDEYDRQDRGQRHEDYQEEPGETPQHEKADEDPEEEVERIYNPTYRSSALKTSEIQAQASNRDYYNQGATRTSTLSSRNGKSAQQSRGAVETKSGGKSGPIPQHRFAFNDKGKSDPEMYYNFAHE